MCLNHFQVSGLDFALSVLLFHLWMSSGVSRKNIPNPKTQSGVSGCFQYVMPILLLIASPVSVLTTSLFSAIRHGFAPQNGQGRISTCLSFIPTHPPCIYCRRTSRLARWKNLHLPSMRRNRFHRPQRFRVDGGSLVHAVQGILIAAFFNSERIAGAEVHFNALVQSVRVNQSYFFHF